MSRRYNNIERSRSTWLLIACHFVFAAYKANGMHAAHNANRTLRECSRYDILICWIPGDRQILPICVDIANWWFFFFERKENDDREREKCGKSDRRDRRQVKEKRKRGISTIFTQIKNNPPNGHASNHK